MLYRYEADVVVILAVKHAREAGYRSTSTERGKVALLEQGLVFRQATKVDGDRVQRLTEVAYAPWTARFGYPPLPVTEDYGPRIARGEVWLLEDASHLLGLLVLENAQTHGLIFSVVVSPERQGQGFGDRILDFAEQQTRLMGHAEIRLYTNSRMERNIALYRDRGYIETGRRPNSKRPGWTIVDMAKPLVGTG